MSHPTNTISQLADLLKRADIRFMLTGSIPSGVHGEMRTSNDIDMVIDASETQLNFFLKLLGDDYYADPQAARDALKNHTMFNVIDLKSAWKIDLICRKDRPFSEMEFRRRVMIPVEGKLYPMTTPEDTILSKLEWNSISPSERQLRDILGVLGVQWNKLDMEYLRHWANEIGVCEQLEQVIQKAREIQTQSDD